MKRRIMHVIETLDMGGAENVVANIVNHTSDDFEPIICCVKHSGPVAKSVGQEIEIIELGKGEGNDLMLPFRMAALFHERQIHVVQIHNWGAFCETVVGAVLAQVPRIFQMSHGGLISYPPGTKMRFLKEKFRHGAERFLSNWVNGIIAVSDKVRDEIIAAIGIPAEKVTVIHNGVNVSVAIAGGMDKKRIELGIKPEDNVIGSIGRLAVGKNFKYVLECFADLQKQIRGDLKYILIGDGQERQNLETMVKGMSLEKNVFILGERTDARDWLGAMDVFVVPSLYEGVSIAILEAMAEKRPVVALRVGGNPEVVLHGETGLLVDKDDREGFIKAIADLLKDHRLRKAMGEKAYAVVEEKYAMPEVIEKYEALYRGAGQ